MFAVLTLLLLAVGTQDVYGARTDFNGYRGLKAYAQTQTNLKKKKKEISWGKQVFVAKNKCCGGASGECVRTYWIYKTEHAGCSGVHDLSTNKLPASPHAEITQVYVFLETKLGLR